jgi:hypothetical protein
MPTKIPKSALSPAGEKLKLHLKADKVSFVQEFEFQAGRKRAFDFVVTSNPEYIKSGVKWWNSFAVEVDGGNRKVVNGVAVGRHGGAEDYRKLNAAALLGWRVLRFVPEQVKSGHAIDVIHEALEDEK